MFILKKIKIRRIENNLREIIKEIKFKLDLRMKDIIPYILLFFLFAAGTVAMTLTESTDLITAFSASLACLSNIGPGLGKVGAVENYSWISSPGKWILSFLMLAGRLELYSILMEEKVFQISGFDAVVAILEM